MVSQNIMKIIIQAEDKASATAKKVQDTLSKLGDTTRKTFENTAPIDKFNKKLEESNKKVSVLGSGAADAANKLNQMKITDSNLITPLQKAKLEVSQMGVNINTLEGKTKVLGNTIKNGIGEAWTTVSNKASNAGTIIRSKLSSAVDTIKSKVSSLASSFSGLGGIISSAIGALGVSSFNQLTVGLALTREQMTSLTTATWGSASAAQQYVNYMDQMTNSSLVSLNDLGTAMNTIKMSTGMTNEQLERFTSTVNNIGQRAILMGKDSSEAMTIMQAAGRGLNGEFDVLKSNFGITKEMLMELGWSGAADDVDGYTAALEKALEKSGDMDGMMDTTTGKLKQVEKGFTSAGRQIGEMLLPYLNQALDGMIGLKESCPEVYKGIILLGGAGSLFATFAPALEPALYGFNQMHDAINNAKDSLETLGKSYTKVKTFFSDGGFTKVKDGAKSAADAIKNLKDKISSVDVSGLKTKFDTLKTTLSSIGSKAAEAGKALLTAGKNALIAGYNAVKSAALWAAEKMAKVASTIATYAMAAAQWVLNAAMSANPITIIVIAIVALVAILVVAYYKVDWFREMVNNLWSYLQQLGSYIAGGLTQAWNTFINVLTTIGEFLSGVFAPVWELIVSILTTIWNTVSQMVNVFQMFLDGQISLPEMLSMIWNLLLNMYITILSTIINFVIGWASNLVTTAVTAASGFVNSIITWISQLPGKVWEYITSTASRIATGASQWVSTARTKASEVVSGVISYISDLPGKVYNEFVQIGTKIREAITSAVNAAKQFGNDVKNAVLDALHIHSPGIIQTKVTREFEDTVGNIENLSSQAADVATSFSEALTDNIDYGNFANLQHDTTIAADINSSGIPDQVDVSGMYGNMNTDMGSSLQTMLNENQVTFDGIQNAELMAMQGMRDDINSKLTEIVNTNRNSWLNTRTVTDSQLNAMNTSTKNTTSQMLSAWDTMRTGIISAADSIKSEATTHFDKLSNTIKNFYVKLQNPSRWGGSDGGTAHTTRTVGRSSGGMGRLSNALANTIRRKENLPSFVTANVATDGLSSTDAEYIGTKGILKTNDLIRSGFAGWEDVVNPNFSYIKSTTNAWGMKAPQIKTGAGLVNTRMSLKVKDFISGSPNISFGEFKTMAEALFSTVPYASPMYYNSDRYGSWQNALAAGECNCWDGANALIALANTCGFSGYRVSGYWNNIPHVWAVINGQKMDTTGWQNRGTWTPSQSHAGPAPTDYGSNLTYLEDIATDLKTGKQFNIHTGEYVEELKVNIDGTATVKHEFINLPDSVSAEEVASMINETPITESFIKKLVYNSEFQNHDSKAKKRLNQQLARNG